MLRAPPRPPADRAQPVEARPGFARGRRPSRRTLVALLAVVAVVFVGALAFPPLARARVEAEGARRRLEVTVGSIRPGFFAVVMHDVRVRPAGVAGVDVQLEEVRVELTAGFSVREVVARGGAIRAEGEPDELMDRLRAWRGEARGGGEGAGGRRAALAATGLALSWTLPASGGSVRGEGLRASRAEDKVLLGCAKLVAERGHDALEIASGELELAPDGALRRATASAISLAHAPPRAAKPAAAAAAPTAEPTPPPLPPPLARRGKGAKVKEPPPAQAPPVPEEPVLPLPDLHKLRARAGVLARQLGDRLPEGAKVEVGGLSVRVDVDGEPVAVGPGAFTLERRADRVHVSFASDSEQGAAKPAGTPLSIDAELPLGSGDVVARLSGGPVSLGVLGVREGTKGLLDVGRGSVSGRGQVALSSAGDALTFDGQVSLRSISIKNPRLSAEPLRGLDFSVGARGVLDDSGRLRVDDAQLDMGALHVKTHGTIEETPEHFALSLAIDVAPAACQALLDGAPEGLLPTVRSMRMTGTFGATARVVFDTRAIDKLALDYKVDDACRVLEVPRDLARERFAGAFTYRTYHPDGTPGETTTGPGTPSWTNLEDISPFMVAAVLTTEDGAFYRHKGFNHAAIRSSVQANLKARRFVRGASTITMQLAKNLFLSRQKTLSRKIEEVILTDYLEQVFQKDEMMELYLNVVEFGPDVYGVTQASEHYFGRKPEELNVAEAFFLATLLPSPLRYGKLRDKGEVSESWGRHLHALMQIAAKNGKIAPSELAEGVAAQVVFLRPGEPRPEPRPPVRAPRRDPYEPEADWQPLE